MDMPQGRSPTMTTKTQLTRRNMLKATIGGASGAVAATLLSGREGGVCPAADPAAPKKKQKLTSTELAGGRSRRSYTAPGGRDAPQRPSHR